MTTETTKEKEFDDDGVTGELDHIRAMYDAGVITVNDRDYEVLSLTHYKRLKIYSYFSTIKDEMQLGTLGFLDTPKFREISDLMLNSIVFDKVILSKRSGHFEEYGHDFIELTFSALLVFSYPLLNGNHTA